MVFLGKVEVGGKGDLGLGGIETRVGMAGAESLETREGLCFWASKYVFGKLQNRPEVLLVFQKKYIKN